MPIIYVINMTSTVTAHMNTCGKTNKVTAELLEDGNIKISIESDCPNVVAYAKKLDMISTNDVTDYRNSKVVDPDVRATLSVPCLTPIAVFDAAWMELGLLSKSRAKDVEKNEVEFN